VQEDYGSKQSPSLRSKWSGNDLILAAVPAAPQALPVAVRQLLQPDSSVSRKPAQIAKPIATGNSTTVSTSGTTGNSGIAGKPGATTANRPQQYARQAQQYSGQAQYPAQQYARQPQQYSGQAQYPVQQYSRQPQQYRGQAQQYQGQSQQINRMGATAYATNVAQNTDNAKSGFKRFITPDVQAQVRAKLPRIQQSRVERPYLSDVLNWSIQDRAAYLSESLNRIDVARQKLDEASNWLLRAKNAGAALVPATKPYGESESDYRLHLAEGQSLLDQMLVPYMAEVDLRTRRVNDEQALNQACQAAYNQLYPGGVVYGSATTNQNCNPKK
jgi:hypothetical protein